MLPDLRRLLPLGMHWLRSGHRGGVSKSSGVGWGGVGWGGVGWGGVGWGGVGWGGVGWGGVGWGGVGWGGVGGWVGVFVCLAPMQLPLLAVSSEYVSVQPQRGSPMLDTYMHGSLIMGPS